MKLKIFILLFITPILIIYLNGCCTCKTGKESLNISVEIIDANTWLNLMPGPDGSGSFHINGKLNVTNNETDSLKNLNLKWIFVYQNNEVIYRIKPFFNEEVKVISEVLAPGMERTYTFGNLNKLEIKEELEPNKPVNIQLLFTVNNKTFRHSISELIIEKAY